MNNAINSQAQAVNEQTFMTFQFSEKKLEIQSIFLDEPWLVAADVCGVLGFVNTTDRLKSLDEDEKLTYVLDRAGQKREVNLINESGLYHMIFKSRKPQAKVFRKWVTNEVLPAIRKQGYYGTRRSKSKGDYIDARDTPHFYKKVNDCNVRCIEIDDELWVSVNDVNKAIYAATSSNQTVKKLNAKRTLAVKIHIYGNTHPSWFTNKLGLQLILAGSRKLRDSNQLTLGI